jgi:peptidoglycan hydrolase-like protein with peptidoglycan-binding domain
MGRGKLIAAVFAAALGSAPQAAAAPAASGTGPIAALQAQLSRLGYDPGPLDGVMSAKTQQAMRSYQRATGRPLATGPAGDPVVAAQVELQRLGFLSAAADGSIGPQTRDAIIRFQAAEHLPIDPRVSDRLLSDLERASTPAAAVAPGAANALQAPAPTAPPAEPEVTGRQPLPPGVSPPPIR